MPCYYPIEAYQSLKSGTVLFNQNHTKAYRKIKLPCGKCIGCRLEYSKKWAVRCVHEIKMHEDNIFVTLTYNEQSLPKNGSLEPEDFTKFMKKLRKRKCTYKEGKINESSKIQYIMCGEYGKKTSRPHYHAILFNCDFNDKHLHTVRNGHNVYTSKLLDKIWKHGNCEIGSATFESAAYLTRYILKSLDTNELDYMRINEQTGEWIGTLKRPYCRMSRNPGIGSKYYEKYKKDLYQIDGCIIRGKEVKIPRYYDKKLQKEDEQQYIDIKKKRSAMTAKLDKDNTADRLKTKELVKKVQTNQLKRSYENE